MIFYEEALGKKLNLSKSALFCSQNTIDLVKNNVHEALGISLVNFQEKYLYLPTVIVRNKKKMFGKIKKGLAPKCKHRKKDAYIRLENR